jgi:hypothetical protein
MIQKSIFVVVLGITLASGTAASLYGQATFSIGSASTEVADIGIAELSGSITFTVTSGTTVAAPFFIRYPATITNNAASEISVTGTGGLAGIASSPTIDSSNNTLIINVPAGGVAGDKITIQGVRVSVAAPQKLTQVTTTVTASTNGNAILTGQGTPSVINRTVQPFSVDLSSAPALAYTNGIVINPSTTVIIREGFLNAFTSAVGSFGQTVPTQFRITPFPSIPSGVQLTFAATATDATTGATLTTTSGAAEIVPRADGTTAVVYQFTAGATSALNIESFQIGITLAIQPPASTGTVTFQTTLIPVGIITPNSEFPSTAIPRFLERAVPDETELTSGSVELAFPFRASGEAAFTGIGITNPQNFRASVTLEALDANGTLVTGPNITNPVTLTVPRNGQLGMLANEIFGTGFNASGPGTIVAKGKTSILAGFYLIGDQTGVKLDGATADFSAIRTFVLPFVSHENPIPFTLLEFFNPGTSNASVTLKLVDSTGRLVNSVVLLVPAKATVNREVGDLFAVSLSAFSGGYITGFSDLPVVSRESFGNASASNVLRSQVAIQKSQFHVAHFASGSGFVTELNFVNIDASVPADITLTAYDDKGILVASGTNPVKLLIQPNTQVIRTVEDLFRLASSSLTTGYIQVDVATSNQGPFVSTPALAGSVRFGAANGGFSASLPLFLPAITDFVYSHVAQNQEFYTGATLLNTNSTATSVTVEVFTKDGVLVGTFSGTVEPRQKIAKLIFQLIAAVTNQVGGYIKVRANQPITSFSLFGDTKGLSLSAIPPQGIN